MKEGRRRKYKREGSEKGNMTRGESKIFMGGGGGGGGTGRI